MSNMNRREALRISLAGGAILSLTALDYKRAFSRTEAPSETIRIGCVGTGRQGTGNMQKFMKQPMSQVVAVCDVDTGHLADAAKTAQKGIDSKIIAVGDYRKLLDDKSIDAISVGTPDHWHTLPTLHACQAGKDVYCEKPLTLVIDEGKKLVAAARDNKRIVQTGSQQRSDDRFRQACELVRNGALGTLKTIEIGLPGPNFPGPAVPNSKPPKELDYNTWLGPAEEVPYNEKHVHYLFRFFWDYSGGQQTNFGAHDYDIAQWALGMDNSGPVKVESEATFQPDGWYETPMTAKMVYTYANGVKMLSSLGNGGYRKGITFIGDKGRIYVNRKTIEIEPKELAQTAILKSLYKSKDHHANFLNCVKSRELPICDVEIGHRSATVCHLGNISIRLKKAVEWNPETQEFVNDKEANAMLSYNYREPWSMG